jgi:hypothetical protein
VERMAAGGRRTRLKQWIQHELPLRFEKRVSIPGLRDTSNCRCTRASSMVQRFLREP